jgi:DNA-binding FadR family transcriptional regulator
MSRPDTPDPITDPLATVTPVVSRSAAAQVADQIVLAVREYRLHPGDRLPSERELAERFGVSRPTIREALAALELAGIVESHKGRGTAVIGNSSQVAMWGVEILPPEVFEARLAVEPELARLAAEKGYPEDIAHLHEVLDDLEAEFTATGTYSSDLPIHRAIARAARNPILERALEDALVHTNSPLWAGFRERAFVTPQAGAGHIDEARQVVRYIEQGKAAEAAEVWKQHLLLFRDEMLGRTPEPATRDPRPLEGQG